MLKKRKKRLLRCENDGLNSTRIRQMQRILLKILRGVTRATDLEIRCTLKNPVRLYQKSD